MINLKRSIFDIREIKEIALNMLMFECLRKVGVA